MGFSRDIDHYEDDSLSLTESDFELLNNEDFFDKMHDMFSTSKALFTDMKHPNGKVSKN